MFLLIFLISNDAYVKITKFKIQPKKTKIGETISGNNNNVFILPHKLHAKIKSKLVKKMTNVKIKKHIGTLLICALLLQIAISCNAIPAKATDNNNVIALTFDDGPSEYTDRILDILAYYNSKATFFVVGDEINSYPDVLLRAHSMGCEVFGHSQGHEHLQTLTTDELRENLQNTNNAIANLLNIDIPDKFRPPYGEIGGNIIDVSAELNMSIILWSVNPEDWSHENEDIIYDVITTMVTNGSIILCHDILNATVNAMARVIPELVSRGYTFVTISELLGETIPGEIYRGTLELPIHKYTVQIGDTIEQIAKTHNTTVYTIKILNNLTNETIYPGQQLQLLYVVQFGDTLWNISKNYNTTVDALMTLNGLTSDMIYRGQQFCISESIVPLPLMARFDPVTRILTVQSGDSLWLIANEFNVTVDAIVVANNLNGTSLSVGQKIWIPEPVVVVRFDPVTRILTVQSGDSLWLIANEFNVTVDAIVVANNLNGTSLSVGQKIWIPEPVVVIDPIVDVDPVVDIVGLRVAYSTLVKQGNGNSGYGETIVTLTFDLSDGSSVVKQELVSNIKWGINTVKVVNYNIDGNDVTVTITIVPTGNNLNQLAISNVSATYTVSSASTEIVTDGITGLSAVCSSLTKIGNGASGYGEAVVTLTFNLSDGSSVVKQELVSNIKWGINTVKVVNYNIDGNDVTVTITIVPTGNNLNQLAISNVSATYILV